MTVGLEKSKRGCYIHRELATGFPYTIRPGAGNGAAAANAVLIGVGTSADPATTATADRKMMEFRCSTSAASGDNRLLYMRYALEGAGGGECLRALTMVNENVGTAHGAHLSLGFEAAAGGSECSGLGVAVRGTLHIPDIASWAPTGTYAAVQAEIYSDGAASDPNGMTELSFIRVISDGNATGKADVDTDAFFLSVQGLTSAADKTKCLSTVSLAELPASSIGLKCKVGSDTYWLTLVADAEFN